ncbi:hypothetical protein F2Q68_00019945 [Brassica cretica]|uniref:Uncharacterized protein n=2 Tax=Brassica cretica TaxID=69181 RepID=A0A8S9G0Z9_BRACR|nr:hypothetical protein F2Q68_00019945 [Brassica cretica]KAF3568378.1 hypothetical protein DY000_02013131 [Brassica cretica]
MSKNASIDELPRKYPDEVLPRKIPRDFRGKKKFRGIISEDLFRRVQPSKGKRRSFGPPLLVLIPRCCSL